ncbi:MAG TPA: class I SAM-dependent methyltransferase [Dehalococcoidia bacterium]|nr:class I SAM-dependent methyltransferase [Dehalococcoidia bacterium]
MAEITGAKLSIDPRRLPAGARVIDVGCGDGRHVRAALARGCAAVGVDYDVATLREARDAGGGASFVVADAARLPFRDRAFDAAVCTETLEHLPDDRAAMRELARVTRPGAPLLGAVPSHFTEVPYFLLSRGYREAPGGHVRIYRPPRLFARLRAVGFELESMRYVHFIDSIFWLRYCLTDAVQRARRRSDFEQAVALAVAAGRRTPGWRLRLRAAAGRSRFIAALDGAGAWVWPKSLTFVARRTLAPSRVTEPQPPADDPAAIMAASPHGDRELPR